MDTDTRTIRSQIAAARSDLGETVAALAYKTDVKARLRDRVEDAIVSPGRLLRSRLGVLVVAVALTAFARYALARMAERTSRAG